MSPDPLLDDDLPHTEPPAYSRTRDPVDMVARIKAEGMRLDQYLHMYFQDFSRSELQAAIGGGHVTVNGRPSKASYKVRNDDKLRVELPEPVNDVIVPQDIPLQVLYEDDELAVVNKPPDMVVHPARGNWTGTLANALAFRFADSLSRENGTFRPGIVHRLDRDTSGCILIAKDDVTHREVSQQFEGRTVHKEYVAVAVGDLERDSDYVEAALKHHPKEREKMTVCDPLDPDAKSACSYYEVLERFRGFTLVKVSPKTGRTHQIRVHLLHVGCPVLADKQYGGRSRLTRLELDPTAVGERNTTLIGRQALHAHRLRFKHPRRGQWVEVEAPLPADMRQTLEALRELRPLR